MLQRLVRVYRCQNATLLEITWHGSYLYLIDKGAKEENIMSCEATQDAIIL